MTGPARPRWPGATAAEAPGTPSRHWPRESAQSFGPYDSTVPTARAHVRVVLAEWGLAGVSAAAELVLSELVTNALQATWRLRMDAPVGVRLLADASWLVLEVWDSVQAVPELQVMDLAAELDGPGESDGHGNGLLIVATTCHRWGYFHRPYGGKVVYAMFAL